MPGAPQDPASATADGTESVFKTRWPEWDESLATVETVTVGIQVNGKLRDSVQLPVDCDAEQAKALALASEKVRAGVEGKDLVKFVHVPNRIINFVVKG